MNKALEDIAAERQRQINEEGWTQAHDDSHNEGEMAAAAGCYAIAASAPIEGNSSVFDKNIAAASLIRTVWPWNWKWWKPTDRRRNLIKAGALIVAEIERLDRAAANTTQS